MRNNKINAMISNIEDSICCDGTKGPAVFVYMKRIIQMVQEDRDELERRLAGFEFEESKQRAVADAQGKIIENLGKWIHKEWQDISTAPRDGTVILVGYDTIDEVYEAVWKERENLQFGKCFTSRNGFILHSDATHWMPLPVKPEGE